MIDALVVCPEKKTLAALQRQLLDTLEIENPKTARALVEQAARMIQTLERCCKGLQRPQIIAAIKAWEQKIGAKPSTLPALRPASSPTLSLACPDLLSDNSTPTVKRITSIRQR